MLKGTKSKNRMTKADQKMFDQALVFLNDSPDLNQHLKVAPVEPIVAPALPEKPATVVAQVAESPSRDIVSTTGLAIPSQTALRILLTTDEQLPEEDILPTPSNPLYFISSPTSLSPYSKIERRARMTGLLLCENWRDPEYYSPRRLDRIVGAVEEYNAKTGTKKRLF